MAWEEQRTLFRTYGRISSFTSNLMEPLGTMETATRPLRVFGSDGLDVQYCHHTALASKAGTHVAPDGRPIYVAEAG